MIIASTRAPSGQGGLVDQTGKTPKCKELLKLAWHRALRGRPDSWWCGLIGWENTEVRAYGPAVRAYPHGRLQRRPPTETEPCLASHRGVLRARGTSWYVTFPFTRVKDHRLRDGAFDTNRDYARNSGGDVPIAREASHLRSV